MKLSRKILGVAAGIGVLGASSIAMAAPATTAMEQLLPESIDAVYTLDTTVKNPFENHLKDWIKQSMITEDSASDMALVDLILDNNHLVYGMDMPENIESEPGILKDPEMYMGVRVTDEGFKALYEKAKLEMTITEETYNGETLYVGDTDTVVVHLGDLFIMTSSKIDAMAMVDRYKGEKNDTLANNSNYQEVMTHAKDNAFFSLYVNPAEMKEEVSEIFDEMAVALPQLGAFNKDILDAVKGEGVWISQTTDGFLMNVAIEGDEEKLTELKMNFDKNNFTPTLWKKFSGKGLMMYAESDLADSWMEDSSKIYADFLESEEFVTWKKEFKTDSNIDFDKEILSLMSKPMMFTVHKTEQVFPAFTLMVDVSKNRDDAYQTTLKLNNYIENQMATIEKEEGLDFFSTETVDVGGSKFTKQSFNFGTVLKAEDDMMAGMVSDEKLTLNVYISTTMDGFMVISTHPDFTNMYSHMMTDNDKFKASFPTMTQPVADLGFVDISVFTDYLTETMSAFGASTVEVQQTKDFMSPFGVISWVTNADNDTVWAELEAKVDVVGLAKTVEAIQAWTDEMNSWEDYEVPSSPMSPTPDYCDVEDADWFSSYVRDLSQMDIVKGYEDGCFHPERNITRAEFTKMALNASEKAGNYYDFDSQEFADRFVDVDYSSDWFAPVVDQAAANGLVKGFEGKTFRPNAPIARAEAVQILFNMSKQMKNIDTDSPSSESPFSDVKPTDWFFKSVRAAKYYNLVSGATPIKFEPSRNLTRAEAAKIISGFYNLETPIE